MKGYLFQFALFLCITSLITQRVFAQWTVAGNAFGGEVQCFAESGSNLFCGSDGGGVFLSTDNGGNWSATQNLGMTDKHIHALLVSGPYLLAGTNSGVLLSTNNGAQWLSFFSVGLSDTVHTLLLSGQSIFAGTSHGVYRGKPLSN